jgi:hypothetical protein
MMSDWTYQGDTLVSIDAVPKNAIGFIYLITQVSTGKKYIGRKLLTKAATKTINGKKKKLRVESDWKDYWSSSPKIKQWIDENGYDDFRREVLLFVSSKGMLAYGEELALYMMGALESDAWLNDNIRSKIYRTWVKPDEAVQLRALLAKMAS